MASRAAASRCRRVSGSSTGCPRPGAGGPRLVQAGIDGVRALAASAGVHVPPPTAASSSSGRSVLVWGLAGGALVVLALVVTVVVLRRRRGPRPTGMR